MKRRVLLVTASLTIGGLGWWWSTGLPETPPACEATLLGFRYRQADGLPVFDRDAQPRIQLGAVGGPSIEWHANERVARATLALDASPDQRLVRVDGWPVDPEPGPGRIVLTAGPVRCAWRAVWANTPEALPGLSDAISMRQAGRFESADAALAALQGQSPTTDLWLGVERARLEVARGRLDQAIDAWVAAADDARRAGLSTEEGRRLRAAANIAWRQRHAVRMNDLLGRALAVDTPAADPEGHARLRYTEGTFRALIDDWRGARKAYGDAIEQLNALGEPALARIATEALALLLADLGDPSGALDLLLPLAPHMTTADADTRARYALNIGWLTLRALPPAPTEAQRRALIARLDDARAAARASGDRLREANAAINQAWGALELGDLAAAGARLDDADALDPDAVGFGAPYATLLRARLHLARGRYAEADAAFAAVEARAAAETGRDSELGWRARFGRGRAARARGEEGAALAHFEDALGIVERLGRRASLRGDRATFHADRRTLTDEAIALAITLGDVSRAFAFADAARARPMRALQADLRVGALPPEARRRWAEALDAARAAGDEARRLAEAAELAPLAEEAARRRAADEALAARDRALDAAFALLDTEAPMTVPDGLSGDAVRARLGPGEVLFAFDGGWVFRVDAAGVDARGVDDPDDPLGPWRALPAGTQHVYVVPGGHPGAFRLATGGADPLLLRVPVSFLPYAGLLAAPMPAPAGPPLVVADPRGDLAFAADEGRAVADALRADAPATRLLAGREAKLPAVLAGLADARVFHFAGHGVLHPERPWDAHLRLADPDRLALADVLTHPVAARLVVLSGCETGVDAVLLDDGVVGLPEAFLAAGAGAVLATDRVVDDRATRRFVERFYAAGGAARPAAALSEAARRTHAAGDDAWTAFRLIGRR